ncbi:unnamed protein product, partial [Mesorhabditis belari]|uniref:C2 domain-containing protein n=1 Tax=Mesorhabditis belari TaxID=2138241 RepID=A0AAF3F2S7_9BILA
MEEAIENRLPRAWIAMEYVEKDSQLNFYIKKVSDAPLVIYSNEIVSRAKIFVVKGVVRRSWMGRNRVITEQEILALKPIIWKTLTVSRCDTTIFNEFFSCEIENSMFHRTLLRIQLCDVDTKNEEENCVVVAETDFWIDSPVLQFVEFEIPMQLANPDLGELEFGLNYLLSAQRVIFTNCIGTNLQIREDSCVIFIEAALYVRGKIKERHRTERRDADFEQEWTTKLIFDLHRKDVYDAILVISLFEMDVKENVSKIGRIAVSFCSPSTDHSHWHSMLRNCRSRATQTHKLVPAV